MHLLSDPTLTVETTKLMTTFWFLTLTLLSNERSLALNDTDNRAEKGSLENKKNLLPRPRSIPRPGKELPAGHWVSELTRTLTSRPHLGPGVTLNLSFSLITILYTLGPVYPYLYLTPRHRNTRRCLLREPHKNAILL